MALEKQWRLVQQLAKKTNAGQVDWKATTDRDAFQVSFKDYSLILHQAPSPISEHDEMDYRITLLNESGEAVDEFVDTDLFREFGESIPDRAQMPYVVLKKLFTDARRKATGADKILDSILFDLDDDIPF